MNINRAPVFVKDLKVLSKHLLVLMGAQLLFALMAPLVADYLQSLGRPDKFVESVRTLEWFPKLQIAMGILFGLVCAAQFSLEERLAGTDRFLSRLAAPRNRIRLEKLMAGVCAVCALLVCQWLWSAAVQPLGIELWKDEDSVGVFLLLTGSTAYLIGLPLGYIVNHTMAVILLGSCVEYVGLWTFNMWWMNRPLYMWRDLWPLYVVASIVALVVGFTHMRKFHLRLGVFRGPGVTLPLELMIRKELVENWMMYGVVVVMAGFGLFSDAYRSEEAISIYIGLVALLSAMLGALAYAPKEKDGLGTVLYHHPIPRRVIFGVKFGVGFAAVLLLAFIAVRMASLHYVARMSHAREISFSTNALVVAVLLAPYGCGMLVSLVCPKTIHSVLLTLLGLIPACALGVYLFQVEHKIFKAASRAIHNVDVTAETPSYWLPLLMAIGFALAALRAATDRSVLAGGIGYRTLYVGRLYFFVLAATLILITTGWLDLLYLTTGLDLGRG